MKAIFKDEALKQGLITPLYFVIANVFIYILLNIVNLLVLAYALYLISLTLWFIYNDLNKKLKEIK